MFSSVVVAVLPRPLTLTRWLEARNVGGLGGEETEAVLARDISLRGLLNLLSDFSSDFSSV